MLVYIRIKELTCTKIQSLDVKILAVKAFGTVNIQLVTHFLFLMWDIINMYK